MLPIKVNSLKASYGKKIVLDGISFEVPSGQVTTLLGINGAGKTTCISVLTGLMSPKVGSVEIFGQDPRIVSVRKSFGCTPQNLDFPRTLKVREILEFIRGHYNTPSPWDEVIEDFSLELMLPLPVEVLSGGQTRRLACALAFCGNPPLVFLDEPTTGLDIQSRSKLWKKIRNYVDSGGSVFLTTHYLEEADRLSDQILCLDQGQVIYKGSADKFRNRVHNRRVKIRTNYLPPLETRIHSISYQGTTVEVWSPDSDNLIRELVKKNISFEGLEVHRLSVEEAFKGISNSTQNSPPSMENQI